MEEPDTDDIDQQYRPGIEAEVEQRTIALLKQSDQHDAGKEQAEQRGTISKRPASASTSGPS